MKIAMVVGEPLNPPVTEGGTRVPRRAARELTAELQKRLQDLFDEAEAKAAGRSLSA